VNNDSGKNLCFALAEIALIALELKKVFAERNLLKVFLNLSELFRGFSEDN
jgi:hypothetical protein